MRLKHQSCLIVIIIVVLIATMMPVAVFGTEFVSETAKSENSMGLSMAYMEGTNGVANYVVDSDGTLTISGTGITNQESHMVSDIPWVEAKDMITKVVVKEGITSITGFAFFSLEKMTTLSIPASVTSISRDAFMGNKSLISINVDPGNAYYSSVDGILYNKSKTKVILCGMGKSGYCTIPEGVNEIDSLAFPDCNLITGISIPSTVKVIKKGTFEGCTSLTSASYNGDISNLLIEDNNEDLLRALGIDPETYYSKNDLKAYAKDNIDTFYAEPQQYVTLSVVVEAADKTDIQYRWEVLHDEGWDPEEQYNDLDTISVLVFDDDWNEDWFCFVTDRYGNTASVKFTVYSTQTKDGWRDKNGNRYYYSGGIEVTGWKQIDGKWYCFTEDGVMMTGWRKIGGKYYYLGTDGAVKTGWQQINEIWYYFGNDGVVKTGWQQISKKWYYFGTDAVMKTGWQQISEKWYYFGKGGSVQTGWVKYGGKYYYLNPSTGALQTGWVKYGGKYYYMNPSTGALQTGWVKSSKKWYYLNPSTGAMVTGWQKVSGKWYYLGSNGVMVTGWMEISSKWYYFGTDGAMVTGTQTINGKTYTFNSSGVWVG